MEKVLISEYVNNTKNESGLTISQFANLHNVSRSQMAKYISGELDNPSLLVIAKFCRSFNMEPEQFASIIKCDNTAKDDFTSFISSVNHLMNSEYEIDPKKYIYDFFEKCHEKYHLHSLLEGSGGGYNIKSLGGDARMFCYNSSNSEILIEAVKYKKRVKGKETYYNNELDYTILKALAYGIPIVKNYLILTPSEVLFDSISINDFTHPKHNNVILLYYKHNKNPKYKLINDCYDFLK